MTLRYDALARAPKPFSIISTVFAGNTDSFRFKNISFAADIGKPDGMVSYHS